MAGKQQIGIGSTIIEKDGKFTFVAHPTTEGAAGIPSMQCPTWFDTVEEAKEAGSRYLDFVISEVSKKGLNAKRTGNRHHTDCRSSPNCDKDPDGCLVMQDVLATQTESEAQSSVVVPISEQEFLRVTGGAKGVPGVHDPKEWWAGKGKLGVLVFDLIDKDWSWLVMTPGPLGPWDVHSQGVNFPSIDLARESLMKGFNFTEHKTVFYGEQDG